MTIEELQEQLLAEREAKNTLVEEVKNLKTTNEKLKVDNERLTEYNNKLFMRVTEPKTEAEKPKEKTDEEREADLIAEIRKKMKGE